MENDHGLSVYFSTLTSSRINMQLVTCADEACMILDEPLIISRVKLEGFSLEVSRYTLFWRS